MYLKYFIGVAIGLFFGIFITYKSDFSSQFFIVSSFICIINFFIYKFSKRNFGVYRNETSIFLSILFLFLSLSILLSQFSLSKDISHKEKFENSFSQKEIFIGKIREIKNNENSKEITLNIKDEKEIYRIKILTSKLADYKMGQDIKVEGKINLKNILLPSTEYKINNSFDINSQNNLKNIDADIIFPKITVLENSENDSFKENIENLVFGFLNFKNEVLNIFEKVPSRNVGALSAGTLLGDDSLFSKEEKNNFRIAGLSHIIVLSGFNISILISSFSFLFLNLNFDLKKRIFFTIFSIFIFIIFVGISPSIVRAGIMGVSLLLAYAYGKQYTAKQFLFLSVILMMIINTKIAIYDASFHLSFLATFAILYFVPILEKYSFFKKEQNINIIKKNILEVFKITLSVQIFVIPYIIFTFNEISIFGLISNILVLPFVPIIMLLAFLIIIFYFIFAPISILFSYISFVFSKYIFLISELISSISFSKIEINISVLFMILIYLFLIFFIYFEEKRFRIKKYLEEK